MMAVTPIPPAVQTEISPRFEPRVGKQFRERRDDARAGRRERVADRDRAALDVQLRTVDRAERLGEAEPFAAELLRLPGLQRAEHLRGKSLVDLVEIEVLERESRVGEHRGTA